MFMEKMKLTLLPNNHIIEVNTDQTILSSALERDIPIAHACGGNAKCSSCRIYVTEGVNNCFPRTKEETILANALGFSDQMRLACQTRIKGPVTAKRQVVDEIDLQIVMTTKREGKNSIGEEREVSVMFADIEDYTTFSESRPPYDIVHLLNRYYFIMGTIIKEYNGYIMDYFGDGFLAIFGLEEPGTHPQDAVNAGLKMFEELDNMNKYFMQYFDKHFNIRLGINTGKVIMGTIGIKDMQKLAAIGDMVNFASRIESANKQLKTNFLISEATYKEVKGELPIKGEHIIEVKGKTGEHRVYEVEVR